MSQTQIASHSTQLRGCEYIMPYRLCGRTYKSEKLQSSKTTKNKPAAQAADADPSR